MEALRYIRFSTAEQAAGGSLERQRADIADHIARNGWTTGEEFFDRGKSAFKNAHRQGSASLARLEAEVGDGLHAGKVLVVEKLDRLSRLEPLETIDLMRHFLRHGVSITASFNGVFYKADETLPTDQIYPLIAEADGNFMFSKTLQKRVTSGWQRARKIARESGKALTKKCPLWLRVVDGRFLVIEDRAALVRRWFSMADEEMGARTIVRVLEGEGVPTWGRSRIWNRSYISKVLANRAVLGEFQTTKLVDGKRVPDEVWTNYYPAIVSPDLFARVNANALARKATGVGRKEATVPNLFAGMVRCQCCDGTVNYQLTRKAGFVKVDNRRGSEHVLRRDEGRLKCRIARASGGKRCQNKRAWSYLTFEDAIIGSLLPLAMDEGSFANRGEVSRLAALIAERERGLELATEKAKRLWSAWAEGGSDSLTALAQEADSTVEAHKSNLAGLRAQHREASGRVSSAAHLARLEQIADNLHAEDLEVRLPLRRKVSVALNQLIDRITVSEERATIWLTGGEGLLFVDRKGKVSGFDLHKPGRGDHEFGRRHALAKRNGKLTYAM